MLTSRTTTSATASRGALAAGGAPGYARIKHDLITDIRAGRWRIGELIPSEHQLLGRFKVSRATIVRSLNELVLEGYLHRKRGKGTFVADYRSNERRAPLLLFVASETYRLSGNARQTLLRIMHGVEAALGPGHPGLSVRQAATTLDEATVRLIDDLRPRVALIIEPGSMPGLVQCLQRQGCATWAINEPTDHCNCVYIDQETAGYLATRYLIERGRRRIALLNGPVARYWGFDAKLRGYRRALTEAGLPIDAALIREASSPIDSEAGREMLKGLLATGVAVDGAVGSSDSKAIGAMAQAMEMGRRVPDDIAFVSIDNTIADQADPPLPAVELPFTEMGRQVVLRAVQDDHRHNGTGMLQQIRLQPSMVERPAKAP